MRLDSRVVPFFFAGLIAACSGAPREGAPGSSASSSPPPPVQQVPSTTQAAAAPAAKGASAELVATQGNQAHGTVGFEAAGDGVRVTAHIEGLTPGEHGFHLHDKPDCSAPDASSAGDHWNPTGQPHGAPDAPAHHAGDLGNITADASGTAHVERVVHGLALDGAQSIVGHSVIVHAHPDDLRAQPSGNSGPRVTCGVVATGGLAATRPRDPGD